MKKLGAIVIIEDNEDDQLLFQEVFKNLKYENELLFFCDGQTALDFLDKTEAVPFLILSDINMPKINGLELREKLRIDCQLKIRCIPYLFFSTAVSEPVLSDAYSNCVQGFFIKNPSLSELEKTISAIMTYWGRCIHANDF